MIIRVLGAHNTVSKNTRYMTLLIDDILALDAGCLASSLSFRAQQKIKAVFITHQHYDHIRDVPALAINFFLRSIKLNLYGGQEVRDAIAAHLMNKSLYPDFMQMPQENPTLRFNVIEPLKPVNIEGYELLGVKLRHSAPDMGYQVTAPDGKSIFYTGDTGPDLAECWQRISPQVLFIEVTASDRYRDFAAKAGHLTPGLLQGELVSLQTLKGYLPRIIAVHTNPTELKGIKSELSELSRKLSCDISIAHEGMSIQL